MAQGLQEMAVGTELEGIIVRDYGLWFDVQTKAGLLRCTLRGILKRERVKTDPAAVGDRVRATVASLETDPPEGVIEEIAPRQRVLSRLARGTDDVEQVILANPDQLLAVFAIREPDPSPRMIDRMLIIAEARELPAAVCFNKLDLLDSEERLAELTTRFEMAGYPVLHTSAATGQGLDELREYLRGKVTAFAGPSGVGKSTLLNALAPGIEARTGAISDATGKGRHTTTWTELFEVAPNTYIADTPGMRQIGLWGVDMEYLDEYFREFEPYLGRCRFADCRHLSEPGCAVREALADGKIHPDRYDSYRALLEDSD
ncbi:MAG TPA: ribosome small subunit-dependent GTPase A [Thermomicrobiales bacterium]|nr:ribosome small subunit-dependent GTPase A [Thermomicrobiales bacterium]